MDDDCTCPVPGQSVFGDIEPDQPLGVFESSQLIGVVSDYPERPRGCILAASVELIAYDYRITEDGAVRIFEDGTVEQLD